MATEGLATVNRVKGRPAAGQPAGSTTHGERARYSARPPPPLPVPPATKTHAPGACTTVHTVTTVGATRRDGGRGDSIAAARRAGARTDDVQSCTYLTPQ